MTAHEKKDASVRERELELALAKIERMSRPIYCSSPGNSRPTTGRVEQGSLAEAARIAREALDV